MGVVMNICKSVVVFFIAVNCQLLIVHSLYAQTDYQRQYINGKNLFNERKYKEAMENFKPLIVYDANNYFSEYASFYYALSAYQQSYYSVAKDMLLQVKQLYPNWDKIDEVNFWLARIHFDGKEYYRAMAILNAINNKSMLDDIAALKQNYFSRVNSLESIEMLHKEFPDELSIGKAYANAILRQPLATQDREKLDQLIKKFKLPKEEYTIAEVPKSVKKDTYRVAVLLPFAVSNLHPSLSRKPNQFVIDFYDGLLLGLDSLKRKGITIELLTYDTERSGKTTEKILQNPQLKQVDLIIGPMYRDPMRLVNEFGLKHRINVVNPLTNDGEVIEKNPFAFLFNPSYATLGIKSAEYLASLSIRRKDCMIIRGDQKKDSVMAANFETVAIANELNIVANLSFRKENSQQISDILSTPTEIDDKNRAVDFTLRRDSIGCIFVTTEDPLIYMKVVSSIEARGDSVLVIGSENWLETATIDYSAFERLGVSLFAPGYYNQNSKSYQRFQSLFIQKYGRLPNGFSRSGYEQMLVFGRLLNDYGNYFQHGFVNESRVNGVIFSGVDYSFGHDSHLVPIIQFREGDLKVVNKHL